jgi:FAD/FMN-containing dehydrogenase
VPHGWFLPVTPGTQYVTVGGAIANDDHGKNPHRGGSFGCHVRCFELLRSDGARILCSAGQSTPWYQASIGGLGLTGLITWAEIQLKRIHGPYILQDITAYENLDEFLELSRAADATHEYSAAWIDCLSKGSRLGRGIFVCGNHLEDAAQATSPGKKHRLRVPFTLPFSLVNPMTVRAFNSIYYQMQRRHTRPAPAHYADFFYPLDTVGHWNRVYGPRGFFQYQCVIPPRHARDAIAEILSRVTHHDTGSFFAVLKVFGDQQSPGILSFPRPGWTLALDFPNQGTKTFECLSSLDEIVRAAGGAVYPAKDARMDAKTFRESFPRWREFEPYVDERFSSSFWRRVSGAGN